MKRVPVVAFCVVVLASSILHAKEGPPTPVEVARRVLSAFAAGDSGALETVATESSADPWLVVEELRFEREYDAAKAFAKAGGRADTSGLVAYVGSARNREPDPEARRVLAALNEALGKDDAAGAVRAARSVEPAGDVTGTRIVHGLGIALSMSGDREGSLEAYRRAAGMATKLGWFSRAAEAHGAMGHLHIEGSDRAAAKESWTRALELAEKAGYRAGMARFLTNLAGLLWAGGDPDKAAPHLERAQGIYRELGDIGGETHPLLLLCRYYSEREDHRKSLLYMGRLAEVLEKQERWGEQAHTLWEMGKLRRKLGEDGQALAAYLQAAAIFERVGDVRGLAATAYIASVSYRVAGRPRDALAWIDKAIVNLEKVGDRGALAQAHADRGTIRFMIGDVAGALASYEETLRRVRDLGLREEEAKTLGDIATLHSVIGDPDAAIRYGEKALAILEELDRSRDVALVLANLGAYHLGRGDHAGARSYFDRVLEVMEGREDGPIVANTLGNLGSLCGELGEPEKALEFQRRALALYEKLGDRSGAARTHLKLAQLHSGAGRREEARKEFDRGLIAAREAGDVDATVTAHMLIAGEKLYIHGEAEEALAEARTALRLLPTLVRGLAEGEGAVARERWSPLFAVGVGAALALEDPSALFQFMESGRAIALLESLGGRSKLNGPLPKELREEEREADAAVVSATLRLQAAVRAGDLAEIKARRAELDAAHGRRQEVIRRIQRGEKALADVAYPIARPLDEVRRGLRRGETLVEYSLAADQAAALVVTKNGARIVTLGKSAELAGLCAGLSLPHGPPGPRSAPVPDPKALAKIRKRLVEPLGIPASTKLLLVSADGPPVNLPFSLLVPKLAIAMVPSGTTFTFLHEEERKRRGSGVLALGDPYYSRMKKSGTRVGARLRFGLSPLPGSGKEARAVGDRVLLAKEATEGRFLQAVASRPRWRAVHLACHGRIDTDRPMVSALAFTPDAGNDGYLTCLDVLRVRIPADLVVISACETARGKSVRAEGVVGFTRAFMVAGSPRVICSLWKVDDEATRVLMVKFYELWNPKKTGGISAAAALREAQEFVRGHEKWDHPWYWAAWVLWGLPD